MKIIEKDNLKIVMENNTVTIFTSLTGSNGQSVPVKGSIDVLATFDSGPVTCYFKDERQTYALWGGMIRKIKSSNIKVLNNDYVKDDKNVYCEGQIIPGADPETFTIPPDYTYFAYDKNNVYALARSVLHIFTDADITSLVFFPSELKYTENGEYHYMQSSAYFADKYRIYHFNRFFVEYIQPSKNDVLKNYLKDKKPDANAWWNNDKNYFNTLKKIDTYYYTDGAVVYYHLNIDDYLTIDSTGERKQEIYYPYNFGSSFHVSYFNALIKADIDTFTVLNEYYAKDKNNVFYLSRKIKADVNTFEIISKLFAMDKNGLWYNGFYAGEFDRETFKIIDNTSLHSSAIDKFGEFYSEYDKKVGKYQCRSKFLKRSK